MSKTGKTRAYVFTLKVKKARLVTVLRFKHQWLAYMAIKQLRKRFWFAELTFKQITPLNALWYFFLIKIGYYETLKKATSKKRQNNSKS
ncbi:hypothetical protein J8B38_20640 [Vibrio parahaemolyticus]|uniref:hypothetical protein n=1 Tax=Vibrio parahaemolyticus TaxID=670 RepID=UPI00044E0BA5|nr:hypothetical protein [Vibrio parahaemolyticus]ELB2823366.1 hypothetical protein [Vibrio parahaemolyticus]ETX66075.1 hypothetical protein D034_4716 [Vibrio parahaemolyticus Peru-288]KZW61636.1 hypothetical protein APF67_00245 [Vibrio parahaemolyticus]MBM5348816.1 hypothetical protein [Vibrio parahaemolyticus]MBM5376251.1 hypothetical protein [Vibrio parahaemolyticus]